MVTSVGVAPNKFLAKIASDLKKPDALVVVAPDKVQEFLDPLPVERLWGVGKPDRSNQVQAVRWLTSSHGLHVIGHWHTDELVAEAIAKIGIPILVCVINDTEHPAPSCPTQSSPYCFPSHSTAWSRSFCGTRA
jgi:hypothetical protein